MWRYLAGGLAALALAGAGVLIWGRPPSQAAALPGLPAAATGTGTAQDAAPLPDTMPEASPRSREQKRFGRYDKDRDGAISREEYLASRRKAYARLDANRDGVLQFEEWSGKSLAKFAAADRDRSGTMSPPEFATTAIKRKPVRRPACLPAPAAATADEEG